MQLQREDLVMYVGIAVFVGLIVYDVVSAFKRGALWLPSNYLVQCGLILQLVAVAEVRNVSISRAHQKEQLEKLMAKQLSIDSARLTLCVFMGYLLPGMATTAYRGVWTTIAALLVSLIIHIFMESFIAIQLYKTGNVIEVMKEDWVWLIVSGGALLLVLFCFFLLLAWAVFAGKFYRDNLCSRIKAIHDQNSNNVEEWEQFRDQMLKSWIVARICRPEYILSRSVFSAAVGLLVTSCVGFFGAKFVWLRSVLNQRLGLFVFQSIFILVGWLVIVYRLLAPLYHFMLFTHQSATRISEFRSFFGIFSTPLFHLLLSLKSSFAINTWLQTILFVLLLPFHIGFYIVIGIVLIMIEIFTLIALLLMFLILLCLLVSWWVFGKKVIRKFFKVDTRLGSLSSGDFHKYKVALESLLMPVDEVVSLWMANEHFYNHVKRRMEEAYEKSASCKELIQVIESCLDKNNLGFFANELVEPLPSVKMYFPALKEPLWSLTVVSLLSIIIEVTPSFDVDHSAVDNAMKAYNQAYSLMKLVDCLDNIYVTVDFFGSANLESFIISKASLVGWNRVNEMYEKRKGKRRATGGAETALTLEAALGIIRKRFEEAEHRLRRNQMLEEVPSTRVLGADWFGMAQSYANYKVYNLILKDENCYSTVDDLRENLFAFLKDVISSCVLQLPHLLLTSSRDWASKFEEEKIYEAAKMVGTVQGVIDAATENRRRGAP